MSQGTLIQAVDNGSRQVLLFKPRHMEDSIRERKSFVLGQKQKLAVSSKDLKSSFDLFFLNIKQSS